MSEQYMPAKSRPTPEDFVEFVPYVCTQMQAPFCIEIQQVTTEEYVNKDAKGRMKSRRATDIATEASTTAPPERQLESSSVCSARGSGVVIRAICDTAGHLMELQFQRCAQIPVLLMRVVALCLPYHPSLARITVRWGPPRSRLVRELATILPHSNITELCLDDSPALERNCHALLEQPTQLRSLSLARCDLDDEDCALLAARLCHPEPASRTLAALSLASNAIADAGAAALGEALRTNRTLRHLNLAGNRITDDGARTILRSLTRFVLRPDEVANKRKRLLDHLKRREAIYAKCFNELVQASGEKALTEKGASSTKKKSLSSRVRQSSLATTMSSLALRAEAMTGELLGPLVEPFGAEHTLRRADSLYCVGNLTLSHLNLAYNNLQLASLTLLLLVLEAQAAAPSPRTAPGLLRVTLDGNLLPAACAELEMVAELLTRAVGVGEQKQTNKRAERVKKSLYIPKQ